MIFGNIHIGLAIIHVGLAIIRVGLAIIHVGLAIIRFGLAIIRVGLAIIRQINYSCNLRYNSASEKDFCDREMTKDKMINIFLT